MNTLRFADDIVIYGIADSGNMTHKSTSTYTGACS